MAAEVPVNARYDLNLEDLLVKNEAGLVYKNEEEFIANLKKLKEDKEFRDKIIKNAFRVSQDYTSEKFGERVEAVYKKTIEEYDADESFTIFRGEKFIQQIRRWASPKSSKRSPWSK
jgi:glycosyltransferase, group 1 family